ncbi:hypothetical protein BDB01DRAFT_785080 [Pilobolus umbonatus]|nr:hypothetical protein BDB01DRAFT_785080 [Pilobolus umbonatus]
MKKGGLKPVIIDERIDKTIHVIAIDLRVDNNAPTLKTTEPYLKFNKMTSHFWEQLQKVCIFLPRSSHSIDDSIQISPTIDLYDLSFIKRFSSPLSTPNMVSPFIPNLFQPNTPYGMNQSYMSNPMLYNHLDTPLVTAAIQHLLHASGYSRLNTQPMGPMSPHHLTSPPLFHPQYNPYNHLQPQSPLHPSPMHTSMPMHSPMHTSSPLHTPHPTHFTHYSQPKTDKLNNNGVNQIKRKPVGIPSVPVLSPQLEDRIQKQRTSLNRPNKKVQFNPTLIVHEIDNDGASYEEDVDFNPKHTLYEPREDVEYAEEEDGYYYYPNEDRRPYPEDEIAEEYYDPYHDRLSNRYMGRSWSSSAIMKQRKNQH